MCMFPAQGGEWGEWMTDAIKKIKRKNVHVPCTRWEWGEWMTDVHYKK